MDALSPEEIRHQAAEAAAASDTAKLESLAQTYTVHLSPMFHLIPWDENVIISSERFERAYAFAAQATANFSRVTPETIIQAISDCTSSLIVFRVIAGYRIQELAYALTFKMLTPVSEGRIKGMESSDRPATKRQNTQRSRP